MMSAFSYPLQKQRESKREWSAPSLFHIPAKEIAALPAPEHYHKRPLLPSPSSAPPFLGKKLRKLGEDKTCRKK